MKDKMGGNMNNVNLQTDQFPTVKLHRDILLTAADCTEHTSPSSPSALMFQQVQNSECTEAKSASSQVEKNEQNLMNKRNHEIVLVR